MNFCVNDVNVHSCLVIIGHEPIGRPVPRLFPVRLWHMEQETPDPGGSIKY